MTEQVNYNVAKLFDAKKMQSFDIAKEELVEKIAKHQLRDPVMGFRELVANGLDAESKHFVLRITPTMIRGEDFGHGIKNIDEFVKLALSSKANPDKSIGYFGWGRLSFFELADKILFETNNGEIGMQIPMFKTEISGRERIGLTRPEKGNGLAEPNAFLQHRGTAVTMFSLTQNWLERIDEIRSKLQKIFGLRILQGAEIVINGQVLQPGKFTYPTDEKILFQITNGIVTGNIEPDPEADGKIDIYHKKVFIESLLIDPTRGFKGWVNCDALMLTSQKDGIQLKGQAREEMLSRLRSYVEQFPVKEVDLSNAEKAMLKRLNDATSSIMRELNILPMTTIRIRSRRGKKVKDIRIPAEAGTLTVGKGSRAGGEDHDPGSSQPADKVKTKARDVTKPLVSFMMDPKGSAAPAVRLEGSPRVIVMNVTHPQYKHFLKAGGGNNLGRYLAPFIARIIVKLLPDYEIMKEEERDLKANEFELQLVERGGLLR